MIRNYLHCQMAETGGKTWLIPIIRKWLTYKRPVKHLCEPFLGGGIVVSLSAAYENLAEQITMVELDEEIASVWDTIVNGDLERLANRIFHFELTSENVQQVLQKTDQNVDEKAFCTILKNRVFHGGIMTKGSGLIKTGENGKGLKSRWYPKTLRDRILAIRHIKHKLTFTKDDAFEVLESLKDDEKTCFFIDPPYTVAGKRLYTHSEIDHDQLFALTAHLKGNFMLTYDDSQEIRNLADKHCLKYKKVPMKTTHNIQKSELIICNDFEWLE